MYLPTAIISETIFEELIFIGLLLKYVFAQKPIIGLITSSLIFVAIHENFNIGSLLYPGIPGLVFGVLYLRTKKWKLLLYDIVY